MDQTKSKNSTFKMNLLLALFATLFTLGVCEVALHFIDVEKLVTKKPPVQNWANVPERVWTEHHPVLGWYHQKNKEAKLTLGSTETTLNLNSEGFRGTREYSLSKPAGGSRVVVVGDSFAFGWGVKDNETFGAQLEEQHSSLEVINGGVSGYGVDQILMFYREIGRQYQPDVVVMAIFPEDFWRATRAFSDTGHAKPYFVLTGQSELTLKNVPIPPQYQLKTDQFPVLVKPGPIEAVLLKSKLYSQFKRISIRLGKNLGIIDPAITDEWRVGSQVIAQLIKEIKEDGAKPIFMLVPPDRWVRSDDRTSLHKSIRRFAKRNRVEFIDMTDVFQEHLGGGDLRKYYIEGDWHWNAAGHKLAAEMLNQSFESIGFKP